MKNNYIKIKKKLVPVLSLVLILVIFIPVISYSSDGLVPCNGVSEEGTPTCGFSEFLQLIATLLNFILFRLAIPFFAILFAYSGILYITAGGNTEKVSQAKKIWLNAFVGFLIALLAWLIIKTIMVLAGFNQGADTTFKTFFNS